MVDRRGTIQVEVRNEVLWVGSAAYPVRNIARTQTIALVPQRGRAVARCLGFTVLWIIVGFVVMVAGESYGYAVPAEGVAAVVGLLLLIHLVAMVRTLVMPTLYALIIETSGSPHTALVLRNRTKLHAIVTAVLDAINNPRATYGPFYLDNVRVGDQYVNVSGGKVGNIGDRGRIGTLN